MSAATRAESSKERAAIAVALIKARRTSSRAFADCFEMGDSDEVIAHILERADNDSVIEERYPHVAKWREWFVPTKLQEKI